MKRRTAEPVCCVADITHDEWLAYRRTGIGGSDAGTIVGLNPYNSLYALYQDKLGLLPSKEDTEAMRQGRDLEQYVARRWMERTGKRCQRSNYMWRSLAHPFMLADVDREVIGENAGLECKTTSLYRNAELERGEIPLAWYVQCQHYMAVMGYERMYLAVLVLNCGFYTFVLEADQSECSALIEAERLFWEGYVLSQTLPPLDGSPATLRALEVGFEPVEGGCIQLSEKAENALRQAEEFQAQIAILKEGIEVQKAIVMQELGGFPCGSGNRYSVSWKAQKRRSLDSARLQKEHPDLMKEYTKINETRVFRFKSLKGEI